MSDIGASGQAFMDISFAQLHGYKFIPLQQPRSLVVADGRDAVSGRVTHFITTPFTIRDKSGNVHTEILDMYVTKLGSHHSRDTLVQETFAAHPFRSKYCHLRFTFLSSWMLPHWPTHHCRWRRVPIWFLASFPCPVPSGCRPFQRWCIHPWLSLSFFVLSPFPPSFIVPACSGCEQFQR